MGERGIVDAQEFAHTYVPGVSLTLFDKAFENGIWDYDPKFAWDYLPGTKRGTLEPQDAFTINRDYIEEEHKWKKMERQVCSCISFTPICTVFAHRFFSVQHDLAGQVHDCCEGSRREDVADGRHYNGRHSRCTQSAGALSSPL